MTCPENIVIKEKNLPVTIHHHQKKGGQRRKEREEDGSRGKSK